MSEVPNPPINSEQQTQEQLVSKLEQQCNKLIDQGHKFHEREYSLNGESPKKYHNLEHVFSVENRAQSLVSILGLSPEQRHVMLMAIAWHDSVLNFDAPDPDNIVGMVTRHGGAIDGDAPDGARGNEAKSFQLLKGHMVRLGFEENHIEMVKVIINATYSVGKFAEFSSYDYYEIATKQNPDLLNVIKFLNSNGISEGLHISQPHFEKMLEQGTLTLPVLITALADLGDVGTEESNVFFKIGDAEMRELYYNINNPYTLHRLVYGENMQDRKDRSQVANAFIKWLKTEVGFAVWQALRFEKTMCLLNEHHVITPDQEKAVREMFSHFTTNIRASYNRYTTLQEKYQDDCKQLKERDAFLQLAKKLHYRIPDNN